MRRSGSNTTGARAGWVRTPASESSDFPLSASWDCERSGSGVGGDTRREGAGAAAVLRATSSSVVLRRTGALVGGEALAGAGGFDGATGVGARGGVETPCGRPGMAGSGSSAPRASTCATCVSLEEPFPVA
ncbi:hypothetical protein COSO111634_21655 [Corallococcus soli]